MTPATAATAPAVAADSSLTASWQVTAPAGAGPQSGAFSATTSFTQARVARSITAQQVPLPANVPFITSLSPTTAPSGAIVTINGLGFGAAQGSGYLTFTDETTHDGWHPGSAAGEVTVDSWSDTQITFTVPGVSGSKGQYVPTPGALAEIVVVTSAGISSSGVLMTIGYPQ